MNIKYTGEVLKYNKVCKDCYKLYTKRGFNIHYNRCNERIRKTLRKLQNI